MTRRILALYLAPFDLAAAAFANPLGRSPIAVDKDLLSGKSIPFSLTEFNAPRADSCLAMREQGEQ